VNRCFGSCIGVWIGVCIGVGIGIGIDIVNSWNNLDNIHSIQFIVDRERW
jgi:hypothetical protein